MSNICNIKWLLFQPSRFCLLGEWEQESWWVVLKWERAARFFVLFCFGGCPHPIPHATWANQNLHSLRSCQQLYQPYQSLEQLLTRFTHTHTQIPLSTERSCSCPGTLSPGDTASLSSPESLGLGRGDEAGLVSGSCSPEFMQTLGRTI